MIKIVTDSVCDLPLELVKERDITIIPLHFHFGDETYTDIYDLTHDEFFKKLESNVNLPTTSQINPPDFKEAFQNILDDGNDVLAVLFSSKLSGTCQSGFIAAEDFSKDRVKVIDTKTLTLAHGLLLLKAGDMAMEGAAADEIIDEITKMRKRLKHCILVGTLDHLRRGGRLSASKSFVANMMNVKPILTMDDEGRLVPMDKQRGMKKAMARIIDIMTADRTDYTDQLVGVNYAKNKQLAETMVSMLRENFKMGEILIHHAGSVISTHAGPDCVGVYYMK